MKSMAKEPEKRFQDGRQMADELTVCLDSKKNTGVSPNARPDKKGRLLWIALIVLILVCGGGFYLLKSRQSVQAPPPVETAPRKQPAGETPSDIEAKASASADTIAETPINSETAQMKIQESTSAAEEKTAPSGAGAEQGKQSTDKKKAAYSLLKIDSVPTNAQVFIDDAFKGKTPVDLSLPLGKHEVLVTLRGYYEWEAGIDLDTPGETPLYVRLIAEE